MGEENEVLTLERCLFGEEAKSAGDHGSAENVIRGIFPVSKNKFLIERERTVIVQSHDEGEWKTRSFAWTGSSGISAVASDSSETFALVVTVSAELYIIPTSEESLCGNWRLSEITHFGVQNDVLNPTSVCWWELRNGAHVGIVGDRAGRVVFTDLSSALVVGVLDVPDGVKSVVLHNWGDKTVLLITDLNLEQSSLVLETTHYTYPLDPIVIPSPDCVGIRRCEPRTRLKGLRNFSAEAIASLKQKIVEKTKGLSQHLSHEESYELNPTKLDLTTHSVPYCIDDEIVWLQHDNQTGLAMLYKNPCDTQSGPSGMCKVPSHLRAIALTKYLIFCAEEGSNNLLAMSTVLSDSAAHVGEGFKKDAIVQSHPFPEGEEIIRLLPFKPSVKTGSDLNRNDEQEAQAENSDIKQENKPIFMKTDVNIDDVSFNSDQVVDGCLVWTGKGVYTWVPKYPVKRLLTSTAMLLNPLQPEIFVTEMNRLSRIFNVPLNEIYLMAADIRLSRKEFPQAIALYRLSKCAHVQTALRFAASGHIVELLNFLQVLWTSKGVVIPHPDRVQLGNLAAIGYAKQLGISQNDALKKKCMSFLKSHQYYDSAVALKAFAKAGIWSLVHFLALRSGLQSDLINSLLSSSDIRRPSEERNYFLCLTEPTLQATILVNDLLDDHFRVIEPLLPLFDSDILERLAILYNPCSQIGIAFYEQLCELYKKLSSYSQFVIPSQLYQINKPVNCVLSCGYGASVAWHDRLYVWGMGPCGTMDQPPSCGGSEFKEPCILNFFETLKLKVLDVAIGKEHCIVVTDRGVFSWGDSRFGQLGLGCVRRQKDPRKLEVEDEFVRAVAGMYHSLLLTKDGRAYSFGWGVHGQLGHGNSENLDKPQRINRIKQAKQIAAGYCHSAVLTTDCKVFVFGSNYYGQTGTGDTHRIYVPAVIDLPSTVLLSAGYFFTVALTSDGEVYVCGATPMMVREQNFQQKRTRIMNAKRNMGVLDDENGYSVCKEPSRGQSKSDLSEVVEGAESVVENGSSNVPKVVISYADAVKNTSQEVAKEEGPASVMFLKKESQIVGLQAKEGVPSGKVHLWPRRMDITSLERRSVKKVSCSSNQISFLTQDGILFSWRPKLGLTEVWPDSDQPVEFEDVEAGWDFCVARDTSGELWSWGNNANAQLGFLPSSNGQKDGKSVVLKNGKKVLGKMALAGNCVTNPRKIVFPDF